MRYFIFLIAFFISSFSIAAYNYRGASGNDCISLVKQFHKNSAYASCNYYTKDNPARVLIDGTNGNTSCPGWLIETCSGSPDPEPTPDPCKTYAGKSAGDVLFPIPGLVDTCPTVSTTTCAKIENKEAVKQWRQNSVRYSCSDQCQVIWDNDVQPDYKHVEAFVSKAAKGTIYLRQRALYTGKSCTSVEDGKMPNNNTPAQPEPPKQPQSQNDCPSYTTFGQVNAVNTCVKNAPTLNASGVAVPTKDDGKVCVYDCDKWKTEPNGSGESSGDSKNGTGTGVDGDGQQGPSKNGGGTPDSEINAKDENGNPIKAPNKGFGEIKQDDIYQSKYREKSFGSIWSDKKEKLLNTGFIKGISDSFPKVANSGTAPKFTIDLSTFKMGSVSYELPSNIILFVKACLILTACFTARKIIWG